MNSTKFLLRLGLIIKVTSSVISSRGSKIWNNCLHEFEKTILSFSLIFNKLKRKLLESEDELASNKENCN